MNNSTTVPTGNALTDAGAFILAETFYETLDQGGGMAEWNDAVIGIGRGLRGGSWQSSENSLRASNQGFLVPNGYIGVEGFRIVIVPEPSVAALAALGTTLLLLRRHYTL